MVERDAASWLVLDGYEDEPAAFGVPPYVGFHIRYVCGVLEQHNIDYTYVTIDQWRLFSEKERALHLQKLGRFRLHCRCCRPWPVHTWNTNLSKRSTELIRNLPQGIPALFGGWAVRGWKQQGWLPLRSNLFLAVQDTDATLNGFLRIGTWKHERRTAEQWSSWAHLGAKKQSSYSAPRPWNR